METRPRQGRRTARVVVIGAGSRGTGYAQLIQSQDRGVIAAVAEPSAYRRNQLGKSCIWGARGADGPAEGESFTGWKEFVEYETARRKQVAGQSADIDDGRIDAALVCVLDGMHVDAVRDLAPLELHILCEKPLAPTLNGLFEIQRCLGDGGSGRDSRKVFAIGHVLRYSPVNRLLWKLVREENVVGDVVSVEHTEPVGWWHFAHSYVRGNWRKESQSAPSLLTKSCHDIDFLLWLLCWPDRHLDTEDFKTPSSASHLPTTITSSGSLHHFRKDRKPAKAGRATNCLSCPIEPECKFSAKNIYDRMHLQRGHAGWPVKVVVPEIESLGIDHSTAAQARSLLMDRLAQDYGPSAASTDRSWYGRCVWEADNDVCDDQTVTLTWADEGPGRRSKRAVMRMVAFTEAVCVRRGRVYGTDGELTYDGYMIRVHDFMSGRTTTYDCSSMGDGPVSTETAPIAGVGTEAESQTQTGDIQSSPDDGHGGGDAGLTAAFMRAVGEVINGGMCVSEAERLYLGATLEEAILSHAFVFAAEDARLQETVIRWQQWWAEVNQRLQK